MKHSEKTCEECGKKRQTQEMFWAKIARKWSCSERCSRVLNGSKIAQDGDVISINTPKDRSSKYPLNASDNSQKGFLPLPKGVPQLNPRKAPEKESTTFQWKNRFGIIKSPKTGSESDSGVTGAR